MNHIYKKYKTKTTGVIINAYQLDLENISADREFCVEVDPQNIDNINIFEEAKSFLYEYWFKNPNSLKMIVQMHRELFFSRYEAIN